ncbi:Spermine oxidase [Folsomia candida]|uniref:Amine oxidase n=1 Tax=Folsomia candida TaxID=158441 RepID=A0A226D1L4_FOLCA|nr:Spermine oxidase [Folsomia candida]
MRKLKKLHSSKKSFRQNPGSVAVIGGGIAGLKAASMLHAAGYNVTLLEASDRIGGRTHTIWFGNESYTELGAEWVHGERNNSIFQLMNPLGVLQPRGQLREFGTDYGLPSGVWLQSNLTSNMREYLNYTWFDPEDWREEVHINVSQGVWARYVLERFNRTYHITDDPEMFEAIYDWAHRTSNAEESATSWFDVSGNDWGDRYIWLYGEPDVRWKPPYSYHTLAQFILSGSISEDGNFTLPDYIKLNQKVESIQYSTNGQTVNVSTQDETYSVDHVIFTGSLGVLKANHATLFTPPLSTRKQLAINNIGFGSVIKIAIEFAEPWWTPTFEGLFPVWNDIDYSNETLHYWRLDLTDAELATEYDGIPLWVRAILTLFNVDSGSAPNVLRAWVAGNPARFLDRQNSSYIQTHVVNAMRQFLSSQFPNITEPINLYKSNWGEDSNFGGTYSYRRVESDAENVWAADLGTPILNLATNKPLVCFAGEATHPHYYSTVHGAYDSAVREVDRIVAWGKMD